MNLQENKVSKTGSRHIFGRNVLIPRIRVCKCSQRMPFERGWGRECLRRACLKMSVEILWKWVNQNSMLWKHNRLDASLRQLCVALLLFFLGGGGGLLNAIITLYWLKILFSSHQSGRKYTILVIICMMTAADDGYLPKIAVWHSDLF